MYSTISLREYRVLYPETDTIPSLTQMGAIGFLLERSRQKQMRRERIRADRRKLFKGLFMPVVRAWQGLRRHLSSSSHSSASATPSSAARGT
jgi:hypothetical protein